MTHTYSIHSFIMLERFFLAFYNHGVSEDDPSRIVNVWFRPSKPGPNYNPNDDDTQLEWTIMRENQIGVQFPQTYTIEELDQILGDMLSLS